MADETPRSLKRFPHSRYHPEARLLTWHPRGMFDDRLADEIVEWLEAVESVNEVPFHRYTDLGLLTDIHLRVGHVFEIAEQRRTAAEPIRSAFFGETPLAFGIARLYQQLMRGATIRVRAFRDRAGAADWLQVPVELLMPE